MDRDDTAQEGTSDGYGDDQSPGQHLIDAIDRLATAENAAQILMERTGQADVLDVIRLAEWALSGRDFLDGLPDQEDGDA